MADACGELHAATGRRCEKPPGHWRFRDRRRRHSISIPHTGRIAETYKATHVITWRTRG